MFIMLDKEKQELIKMFIRKTENIKKEINDNIDIQVDFPTGEYQIDYKYKIQKLTDIVKKQEKILNALLQYLEVKVVECPAKIEIRG